MASLRVPPFPTSSVLGIQYEPIHPASKLSVVTQAKILILGGRRLTTEPALEPWILSLYTDKKT